jgi:hypothetical protein
MNERVIIIFMLIIMLNGCVGDQQNINKEINKDIPTEEIKRDKTPSTPRINIPTHTF